MADWTAQLQEAESGYDNLLPSIESARPGTGGTTGLAGGPGRGASAADSGAGDDLDDDLLDRPSLVMEDAWGLEPLHPVEAETAARSALAGGLDDGEDDEAEDGAVDDLGDNAVGTGQGGDWGDQGGAGSGGAPRGSFVAQEGTQEMRKRVARRRSTLNHMTSDMFARPRYAVEDGAGPPTPRSQQVLEQLEALEDRFQGLVNGVLTQRDIAYSQNVSTDMLLSVKHEIAQLGGFTDKFQFEGVDAVIVADLTVAKEEARFYRKSLNQRCKILRDTMMKTRRRVEYALEAPQLDEEDDDHAPPPPPSQQPHSQQVQQQQQPPHIQRQESAGGGKGSNPRDGREFNFYHFEDVRPDWSSRAAMQRRMNPTDACKRYATAMVMRNLPVDRVVYSFLASPEAFGYTLSVADRPFPPEELTIPMSVISSTIQLYGSLQALCLTNCDVEDEFVAHLCYMLPKIYSLRTLSLRDNSVTSTGARMLAEALVQMPDIQDVHLDQNLITAEGMLALSDVIPRCRNMSSFTVSYNPLGDTGVFYLVLSLLNPLRHAYFRTPAPPGLTVEGYLALPSIVRDTPWRTWLNDAAGGGAMFSRLSSANMYDESGNGGADCLDFDQATVDSGALSGGQESATDDRPSSAERQSNSASFRSGSDSRKARMAAVKRRITLRKQKESEAFRQMRLTQVIRRFRIKVLAVVRFLRRMERGHHLPSLHLEGTSVTSFGASIVAHAIKENPSITAVHLGDNYIGDKGVQYLSNALLEPECKVRELHLNDNCFSDAGMEVLAKALATNKSLDVLDLSANDIRPTGLNWIASRGDAFLFDDLSFLPDERPATLKHSANYLPLTSSWYVQEELQMLETAQALHQQAYTHDQTKRDRRRARKRRDSTVSPLPRTEYRPFVQEQPSVQADVDIL